MKRLILPFGLLCLLSLPALAGNWFGSGPWANSTYYPGNLDGKYQASVTGVNASGVLGFAIRDGAPPFLQLESQSLSDNALIADTVAVNQQIELDRSLNYYAIFVNGRAYAGTTAAAINYDNSTVTGTLLGSAPSTITNTNFQISSQLFTNITPIISTNTTQTITSQLITNTVPIIVTNTTNRVTSEQQVTVTTTNETIEVNDNGFITTTNITYFLTNTNTVFFTNTVQVPQVVGSNSIVQTVFFTNTTTTPNTFTNTTVQTALFTNQLLNPVVISTGVDGGFQANINSKRAVFTFQGPGQLSSPGPVVDSAQVNPVTAFTVNGIRVSFSSQATFQSLSPQAAAQ